MRPPIVFDGVWKKFERGERHDSLRDLIPAMTRKIFGRVPQETLQGQEFWAIKDVSFEVAQGQALGIIGANGAGKSTALKLLTKILRPTRGTAVVRGRVGALIEVAAGFHPDLTGRENIHLQGSIMGMKRAELSSKLDQIIEFAGIGEFIDTPVKRYSSGMSARLGFSIAAHLNPDVLLIDEVLAVGDARFQQRCIDRILALKKEGTTFVFVSHNLLSIETVCDQTLVLQKGCAAFLGQPREATAVYFSPSHKEESADGGKPLARHGSQAVQMTATRLVGNGWKGLTSIPSGAPLEIEVDLQCATGPKDVIVGLMVLDADQQRVFGENTAIKVRPFTLHVGERGTCRVLIESLALPEGRYYITLAAQSPMTNEVYDWHDAAYEITVESFQDASRLGSIGLSTRWAFERLPAEIPSSAELIPQGAKR